jgi:phosphoribosylaminoimidazole-succinocarboxamide synthase
VLARFDGGAAAELIAGWRDNGKLKRKIDMKKALIYSHLSSDRDGSYLVDYAAQRGIIVAGTKFEFGTADNELLLIDECLMPDSSRFWPADQYVVGQSPPSFDKQFVRDYLTRSIGTKCRPSPRLPNDVIEKTSAEYVEVFRRLTSSELASA